MNRQYFYARKDDELFCFKVGTNVDAEDYEIMTGSLARLCIENDYVNDEKVEYVSLGMGFCYCVITDNFPNNCLGKTGIFYSWNIKTIRTSKHEYKVLEDGKLEEVIR